MRHSLDNRRKWLALMVLCLGTLMIVLDTSIVNVALPSIRIDLGFSEASLAWVVNAYVLTFGGFLLLGGRLGDLYGHRRLFLIGLVVFTLSSLACGLADAQWFLIAARAVQGVGGAIVDAVGLSLMVNLFREPAERAKAMGLFGFVAAGGGSLGVFLGGVLTGALNWHWIFLVNIPIGIVVFALGIVLLPDTKDAPAHRHLDAGGAITVTASLLLAVYAVINGNAAGWLSMTTLGLLAAAVALLIVFLRIEANAKAPLMPMHLFRLRSVWVANVVGMLWAGGMFGWFFLSALYMQLVLSYTPLQVGLAFLPANLIMAVFSLGLSARIVTRFGLKAPLAFGLTFATLGLALLAHAPVDGHFMADILPSMIFLGIGAGIALNPVLLAAMSEVTPEESGIASGLVNTSFMMGGALGLAILASVASARTIAAISLGAAQTEALNSGYHTAFIVGGIFALIGALLGGLLLRTPERR